MLLKRMTQVHGVTCVFLQDSAPTEREKTFSCYIETRQPSPRAPTVVWHF